MSKYIGDDPFQTMDDYYAARVALFGHQTIATIARQEYIRQLKEHYHKVKAEPIGAEVLCPICNKTFVKKTKHQAFCSNKGTANCKDWYWNRATVKRLERAKAWTKS